MCNFISEDRAFVLYLLYVTIMTNNTLVTTVDVIGVTFCEGLLSVVLL